jgi:glycosyltransferase involved in cell wall biosynthesis
MQNGKVKIWLPAIRVGTGTDVFTQRLADALASHGTTTQISWFPPKFELTPFLLRLVPPPAGTDIVFANSWNGFAFKRPDIPLIVTVHHSGFDPAVHTYRTPAQRLYHRLLIKPLEKKSFQAADVVTAVSMFTADSVKRATGLGKVEVIHNWIDVDRFHPISRVQLQDTRPFRLLFVGKPSPSKGADLLTPIMRRLGPDFELRIAGRPHSARRADFPPNIRVLSWLNEDDLIREYQECDALLFPSRSEGFGYVALEAMACGKPVIASNVTALPEVINDGVAGILCPVDDVNAFAGACSRLAVDVELCIKMGNAARKWAIEQFSEPQVMGRYLTLIHRLLQR